MMFALLCGVAAILGTVLLASVYLTETVMAGVGESDENRTYVRPSQGMFVSNVLNFLFAVALFLLMPAWYPAPPAESVYLAVSAGVVFTTCNVFYCLVYYDPQKKGEDTVGLACASACTPVIVAGYAIVAKMLGMHDEQITATRWVGVILTSGLMILYSVKGRHMHSIRRTKTMVQICMFGLLAALYGQIMDESIYTAAASYREHGVENPRLAGYFATYLWFWIGNCTTVLWMLKPGEWTAFRRHFPVIMRHKRLIILSEILATLAFTLRIFAYTGASLVVVMALCSTLPIFVWWGGTVMRKVFGYSENLFRPVNDPLTRIIIIIALIFAITLVVW